MKKTYWIRWTSLATAVTGLLVTPVATHGRQIDRQEVERILSTLAADSMRGRQAFSPSANSAARFIAAEFAAIGLEPLDGLDGYRQPFTLHSIAPAERSVTINGTSIDNDRVAVVSSEASFHWRSSADADVHVVGPTDDPGASFFGLRETGRNALVLVDEAHLRFFGQVRAFTSRPSRTFELGDGNLVFVLTREKSAASFEVSVSNEVSNVELANVAGMIPGRRRDEFVLFSAHYDHIGIQPSAGGDSIANGANDNASGTTAVIALADHFAGRAQPERTLLFVAFTAEEVGGFGSQYFSRRLDPDRIVAMFNIEMIGKPAVDGPNSAWITGWDRSDFGPLLQQAVSGTQYRFYPDPYPAQNLFFRSDNATLAQLGVPAHSISTTPIDVDQDYHQVSDEVGTLDLDHVTNTIAAIARGAETIVAGQATPTRVSIERR